jgi:hypothetical protein
MTAHRHSAIRSGYRRAARGRLAASAAVAAAFVLFPLPHVLLGQAAVPLPPAEEFLDAVRENLARSDREQYRYSYRERRSDVHKNPFGRLGTGGMLLYEVTPGEEFGIYFRQLVARDGQPLEDEKPERVDRRDRPEENRSVDDVVATLSFELAGRETIHGRDYVIVDFAPKKDAKPRTRQGKMAKAFEGRVWIDEAAREVTRVDATAVDSLSYGWGIVARLHEGTTISMVRARIDESIWLPTSIRLVGEGRAILFRKLDLDFVIEWSNYRRTLG